MVFWEIVLRTSSEVRSHIPSQFPPYIFTPPVIIANDCYDAFLIVSPHITTQPPGFSQPIFIHIVLHHFSFGNAFSKSPTTPTLSDTKQGFITSSPDIRLSQFVRLQGKKVGMLGRCAHERNKNPCLLARSLSASGPLDVPHVRFLAY